MVAAKSYGGTVFLCNGVDKIIQDTTNCGVDAISIQKRRNGPDLRVVTNFDILMFLKV